MKRAGIMGVLFLLSLTVFGQKLYIDAGLGYDFGLRKNNNDVFTNEMGGGAHLVAGIGYSVAPKFSLELGISYLFIQQVTTPANYSPATYQRNTFTLNKTRLIPTIKYLFDTSSVKIYAKAGLIFGIYGDLKQEYYNFYSKSYSDLIYSGGISKGIMLAVGSDFDIDKHWAVFTQITYEYEPWTPADVQTIPYFAPNGNGHSTGIPSISPPTFTIRSISILGGIKVRIGKTKS